jgi:hypothetical protein
LLLDFLFILFGELVDENTDKVGIDHGVNHVDDEHENDLVHRSSVYLDQGE